MSNYNHVTFFKSAQKLSQVPDDSEVEVAFAGRSNSGKSSAINTITNHKGLAKTSKTPGRTQLLNYFQVTDRKFIVDLPGYGYAKVSKSIKKEWEKTLSSYIETREQLKGVVIIMDIRHPLKDYDIEMINWISKIGISIHILLTKSDKLKRGAAKNTLLNVTRELEPYGDLVSVQLFSSSKATGVEEARAQLDEWFN